MLERKEGILILLGRQLQLNRLNTHTHMNSNRKFVSHLE